MNPKKIMLGLPRHTAIREGTRDAMKSIVFERTGVRFLYMKLFAYFIAYAEANFGLPTCMGL